MKKSNEKNNSQFHVRQCGVDQEAKKNLIKNLPLLQKQKVLIVGDVGLDEYLMGQVRRISPEAPVPVLEVEKQDQRLGLSANVAQNVVSLGGQVQLVSVVGDDAGAMMLKELYAKNGVSWGGMVIDPHRPTTRKTRVMAQHHHLVRVDYELKKYLTEATLKKLKQKISEILPTVDIVILEDYAKGVVDRSLVEFMSELCQRHQKKILVDPNRNNPGSFYQGADLIKPNFDEAMALAGLDFENLRDNPDKVYETGRKLQQVTGAREVVITRGKDGMTIFSGEDIAEVPTYARKVFDVTGAGDTVIAALSLGLASGLSLVESCQLANFAAGVVVGKIGCVPCEIPELIEYIQTSHEHGI